MHPVIGTIFALIVGVVVDSIVNMGLIMVGGMAIPPPGGGDISDMESLATTMHFFQPKHFIFPFLAHAIGTFTGALVAALIATTHKMKFALAVGVFFLASGIYSVAMLPSPRWFTILDIGLAYIPMGYLAGKLVEG
jgi:hypothetical protein